MNEMNVVNPSGGCMPIRFTKAQMLPAIALLFAGLLLPQRAAGQDAVKKGQEVYTAQKCQVCHAIAGKGNKNNALDGVGAKLSAADTKKWITNPTEMMAQTKSTKKPPMPNKYASLPAGDIDALVAYMQSLK
jgi:mono/diheme cytochrome c family protein